MNLRPFTKSDWYGLAGATSFPDGAEPMVAEVAVTTKASADKLAATVVLDAEGLAFHVVCEEGSEYAFVYFEGLYAARAVAAIGDSVAYEVLVAMPGAKVEEATHDCDACNGVVYCPCGKPAFEEEDLCFACERMRMEAEAPMCPCAGCSAAMGAAS